MFKSKFLSLSLLAISFPLFAYSSNDPAQWLDEMSNALASINYSGTFVYIHNDQAESMRIYHRVKDGVTRERLISLDGTPREVVRDADTVKCYLPEDRAVFVEKSYSAGTLSRGIPLNAAEVGENYHYEFTGSGRIAGREARIIAILPKDGFRYGYRIWLDEETALPLRSELMNENERPIEKMMFTEISIGIDIPDALLSATVDGSDFDWHVRKESESELNDVAVPFALDALPAGYKVTHREARDAAGDSFHMIVSDGLASVSVFAERNREGKPALAGVSRLGAVNAFGVRLNDFHVTVVGEVPENTVIAIGEAVKFK